MSHQNTYPIMMNVYVRAKDIHHLPTIRQVEDKISNLLLALPREGEEGYEGWDVSGTCLPPQPVGEFQTLDREWCCFRGCSGDVTHQTNLGPMCDLHMELTGRGT